MLLRAVGNARLTPTRLCPLDFRALRYLNRAIGTDYASVNLMPERVELFAYDA
jgi:hypothetical protein